MADHALEEFFAYAPWLIFAAIVLVTYVATRGNVAAPKPAVGQTFVCAQCGQRGSRDHMVPVEHEGAVAWFCAQCAVGERS